MSTKEIFGFLTIQPQKREGEKPSDPIQVPVQEGNVFFKNVTRRRTNQFWDANLAGDVARIRVQPWKMASLMADDEGSPGGDGVGHSFMGISVRGGGSTGVAYDVEPPTPTIGTLDYKKFRATGLTTTIASTAVPMVIGSVGAHDNLWSTSYWQETNSLISINDVPLEYTQIGVVYQHPMVVGGTDLTLVVGTSYGTFANAHYFDSALMEAHVHNVVRISTGVDAGLYFVRFVDQSANRIYLMNMDGTLPSFTAATVAWYAGHGRRAYFNEVSVIQLSLGVVTTGGTFRPGAARNSFILRTVFDKTGANETGAAAEQQGSYYVTLEPYTHGEGLTSAGTGIDLGRLGDNAFVSNTTLNVGPTRVPTLSTAIAGSTAWGSWDGAVNAYALDEPKQRVWFAFRKAGSTGAIGYWRWKTLENFREVASNASGPNTGINKNMLTPALLYGAGDVVRDMRIGPAGTVYGIMDHASAGNAGVFIIKPDLTTLQYTVGTSPAFPTNTPAGSALDPSRARVGTAADTSTNGSDLVTSTSGAFTTADEGRVIKLTGLGADSGLYKIVAPVTPGTSVNVTTLTGGAVTFTSQSGGTFEIGERLYLFFSSGTQGTGKINYIESLNLGPSPAINFFTRTVTMTNGASTSTFDQDGQNSRIDIDKATGIVYWLSNDTQQQINKYDPTTNAHSFRTIANVSSPAGQTGTVGTITGFRAILVNPKFDEIWVGTDQGHVKLVKSDFTGANYKRYFGQDNAESISPGNGYANPAGFYRPGGNVFIGSDATKHKVANYYVMPDGRMVAGMFDLAASARTYMAYYSREADCWNGKDDWQESASGNVYHANFVFDSIGNYLSMLPGTTATNGNITFGNVEVQYQYNTGKARWEPLEVAQSGLPDKGSTDTVADGVTTTGSKVFTSALGDFVSGDVGKYLRIESVGAWGDIYRITAVNSLTSVDLAYLDGTPFKAASPGATGLSYSYKATTLTKRMHSGLEEVLYGVKLAFTMPTVSANNNQFLGRAAQASLTLTDGSTASGSPTIFNGSGFVSGDVGKLIRVEKSTVAADIGIYKITVFGSATSVTVTKLTGAATFGTAASIKYTKWDLQTAGSNAGPENATVLLADGFGKDNTQDITGITYDNFHFKTVLDENVEPTKFCLPQPIGVPGGQEMKVYYEFYPRVAASLAAHDLQTTQIRALPGAEHLNGGVNGRKLVDGFVDGLLDSAASGRGLMHSSPTDAIWFGVNPATSALGCCPMVDLGADADVGFIIFRGQCTTTQALLNTLTSDGMRANLYKANNTNGTPQTALTVNGTGDSITFSTPNVTLTDAAALFTAAHVGQFITITGAATAANNGCFPITSVTPGTVLVYTNAAAVVESFAAVTWVITKYGTRATGTTNLNVTINVTSPITLTGAAATNNFLGPVTTGPFSNGSTTAGGNTLTGPVSTFVQGDIGKILDITADTSAPDISSYRITAVDGTGAIVTVRKLDQTVQAWAGTASSITYRVMDGVREEDVICIPSVAAPTQRLCVDRLLTSQTAQVRIAPHTTLTGTSWQCVRPTWTPVKRISYSTEAVPPDVKNNGTWGSHDGREQYNSQDFKLYADLTDLPVALRTGRWWQLQMMPRNAGNGGSAGFNLGNFEFYDTSGKRLGISRNNWTDRYLDNADFLSSHINRCDFIQSAYNAGGPAAGFNGNVDLGGANGDTLTLTTGGNKFLGFQVRTSMTPADGVSTIATGNFSSATAQFTKSDVGRILRITSGGDTGNYRINTWTSATQVTVGPPSGIGSTSFAGSTLAAFTIHEGIALGGVAPDRLVFLDDQSNREYSILTMNNAMDSITISETRQTASTNRQWEIRRPAFDTASSSVDSTKLARLVRPAATYPLQVGDIAHDSRGALRFWTDDIGTGNQRADGATAASVVFTGTGFCKDDEGRLLNIVSGTGTQANNGLYRILTFTNSTTVTLASAYVGYPTPPVLANLIADAGPVTYKVFGDRRYKITKQVTTLRA